ncbi:MAG TPA: type II toxin-antitoxin system RelE/ParE family toxin [Bacteroidales bacterium]|jgi:toxin ParE1/3/4|nr:type II toxin-antitoxin system RelE/ParE family toxin [Bacteroidales bacterium]
MRFEISEKAFEDIENIWLYTLETWSIEQADRYYNLIFNEIEFITKYPLSGKDFSHVRKDYRCSKVKSHLIFYKYRQTREVIEIIRVLHQSMDVEDRLRR